MAKNVLSYKGYLTKVQVDVERQVLYGRVDGLVESVDFECHSPEEVEAAFHDAVDRYLAFCEKVGRRPAKSYKGQFSLRMAPALHRAMVRWALANDTTLNGAMTQAVQEFLAQHEAETLRKN